MSPATAPIRSLPRRLGRPFRAIALSAALLASAHSCAPSEAAVQAASPTGASTEEPAASRVVMPTSGLAQDPLWHDGLAEVNRYAMTRSQYGQIRTFDAILLVVKEESTRNSW